MSAVLTISKLDEDYDFHQEQRNHRGAVIQLICQECAHSYARRQMTGSLSSDETLVYVHDVMAAYWRWKTRRHMPYLPGLEPNSIVDWVSWVKDQIEEWRVYDPRIITDIVSICEIGSNPKKTEVRARLTKNIRYCFRSIFE